MADVKISALPAATTPLGGTEVLPIVQSGTTKKVSIADVTAGRAMSASSLTLSSPLGVASGGTGATTSTGSGSVVLGTSPTFTTSAIFPAGTVGAPSITTTGDTNTGIYFPAADTIGFVEGGVESMRLDASGNLGLGDTPSAWGSGWKAVEVGKSGSAVYTNVSNRNILLGSNYYVDSTNTARYSSNGFAAGQSVRASDGAFGWSIAPSGTAGNAISFTQAMTLDASGNLGIGTSSPSATLHVYKASVPTFGIQDASGLIRLTTAGGVNYIQSGTSFSNSSAPLVFGSMNAVNEWMRIDSSGNLLVGTTVANAKVYGSGGGNSPIGRFDATLTSGYTSEVFQVIAGQPSGTGFKVAAFYLNNAAAYASYIRGDGTIFAVSTTIQAVSDARLKENVRDASEGLDTILALKPRRFDWKAGEGNGKKNQIGFIAQEVETVFPDAVDIWEKPEDETEYKSVGASMLVPVLVKAIQELAAKVTALEEQLNG